MFYLGSFLLHCLLVDSSCVSEHKQLIHQPYRESKTALGVPLYVVILGFLLLIEVIINYNIITSPETVQKWMKPYLQEKINQYNGLDSMDQVSLGWNYLMQEYQCCGIDSVSDFQSSAYYARSGCYGYNIVPGCCKTLPSFGAYYSCSSYQVHCGAYSFDTNYWRQSCIQALHDAYYSSNTKVIWSLTGIGVLVQIVLITLAATLINSIKCKSESSSFLQTYENDIWTAGNHTITSEHAQLPPTATTLGTKPIASRIQQTKDMVITVPRQLSFHNDQGPSVTVPPAAPPMHPKTNAIRQHSSFLAQPYLPGSVIPESTSVDKDRMVRQNSYIPLSHPTKDTQLLPRTPTAVPAPVEQPVYVQTPTAGQPENRRTLTVTEVADEKN
ncbi:hypothetical protein CHS0354_007148 [Potamilus streckersoni]|uniref:Tetraspanin n=1 Tax=Potamilus streckersoni TaxID=2493646 RepID=A0AAE0SF07_9BIVA|nr:hypothetical protein CHS0354_007148 [Potamilus streckersoni]